MYSYNSIILGKAHSFAQDVVRAYGTFSLKEYADLYRQFLRSGTSIGANISEATGSISREEFSAKISIAFREIKETDYWILLLRDTGLINETLYVDLKGKLDELSKMAFAILRTTGRIKK